ncbi:MAG: carbonic anhydrase [Coriobacteriia bacterium]|nr:carbonic anhydrase [Coriobacteriia bacterium]
MPHDHVTALRLLAEGNRRFSEGQGRAGWTAEQRAASLEGQQPWAAIVGCSDSRVPVEAVFDAGPGELFVVRTAGHVLAQASLASLRFAVENLGVRTVVVLGHEDCGAVKATLAGGAPEWLSPITRHIRVEGLDPAKAPADADDPMLAVAVDEHVRDTVDELVAFFAEADLGFDTPHVSGGAYKLASGEVQWL